MREALIQSALLSAKVQRDRFTERADYNSCKTSDTQDLIYVMSSLKKDVLPLAFSLTEAGMAVKALSHRVLNGLSFTKGIGDTIRISLTPEPGETRIKEVVVAQELLQTMIFVHLCL